MEKMWTVEKMKMYSRYLIDKFPFLLPRHIYTDEVPKDYDYSYTELDEMPNGWRDAFGEQMCQEIKDDLVRSGLLYRYRVMQIKEKYGQLRWYDAVSTQKIASEIIPKYEKLSKHTCIRCGSPAIVRVDRIYPYCYECAAHVMQQIASRR